MAAHHLQIDRQERDQRDQRRTVAGRKRVGTPDRGLAQQLERNERRGDPRFMADQEEGRHDRDRDQAADHGQGAQRDTLGLLQCEQCRNHESRKPDQPERIRPPLHARGRAHGKPTGKQQREEADRHVDEEDRAPAEMAGQVAARDRTEGVGADRDGREIALITRALARRDRLSHQSLGQRHEAAAAQALQHARECEEADGRRRGAGDRCHDEHEQSDQHQPPPPESVAQPAIDRRGDGGGDEVGHHHPGRPLHLAHVRSNGR